MHKLHMRHDRRRLGRGRGHVEMILGEAGGRTIVEHEAVFAQHQAIARLAHRQALPAIGVEPVEELGRIGTLNVDLAQRGDIGDAQLVTGRAGFTDGAFQPVGFACLGVPARAHPQPGFDEGRAVGLGPVIDRGVAEGFVVALAVVTGESAHGHGRVGWAEGGGSHSRDLRLKRISKHCKAIDIAKFSCHCKVDTFSVTAEASNKKEAKQLAAQLMIDELKANEVDLSDPVKESKYTVEPNATRDWIYSICPTDVEIRKVSWYLDSNCVLLTLGVKRKNPNSSVEKLKKQIEDETKLFVLINRERDAKKAIERLKSVANKDGIITDAKQLEPIALGSYFKPKAYDEPIINWDNRVDHTKDHCFTIDSDSSIDLDDAFSFEVKDNGLFICIHIADVSELVIENSKEDYKAKRQCFSYYGASKQLPMLLNQTMYQASLLPHKDRMAWTVAMQLDHDANLKHYRIYPSVIRSKFRLDQAIIAKLIDKKADKQSKAFELMTELSDKLMQKRLQSGGVTEIAEENIGYQLVQEYMLLANQVVADYCYQKNIPIPYRTHQFADDSIDIKALYNQEKNHKSLMSFLGRASYNVEPKVHEALAFKTYCHFTSPIRRYADLLVQRQLRRFIFGEPIEDSQTMQKKIKLLNQCEQELEISQTTIRYIERLEVQFRQCGKQVEVIIEKEEDGFYFLKALSSKHDRYLMIGTHEIKDKLTIGNSLKVIQESYYDVINEAFGCCLI